MYELTIIFVTTKFTNNHFIFYLSSFPLFFISRRIITIIKIINIIARRGLNKLFRARIHIAIAKTTMNSRRKTDDLSLEGYDNNNKSEINSVHRFLYIL
ncbi:MAG TPA: hypothetical protein VLA74_03895 [Nitrososphaeraceae archaeon]|nr:hypothetical protein [Nitrososphaeraceae archaeon]